jgi:HlyD family secretion protein
MRDAEKAKLDELEAGFRSEEIAQSRAVYQAAVARAEIAAIEYQRAKTLVAQVIQPQATLDTAKSTLDAAEADKRKAAENLRQFETGARGEDIRAQRASYEAAGARLREAQVRQSQLSLIAPRACRVDVLPFRIGERVPAGASLATLLDLEKPYVRVFVPERARAAMLPGREGTAQADGVAREFKVRVRTVSSDASFTPFYALTDRERGRLSFAAKMDLIEPEAKELPVGLPVTVVFEAR